MKAIKHLDPQKVLAENDSEYYMIILVTEHGELGWQGNTFKHLGGDYLDITLVPKNELVRVYNRALMDARMETSFPIFESGSLTVAPVLKLLPQF